jgi:hypothetical protein
MIVSAENDCEFHGNVTTLVKHPDCPGSAVKMWQWSDHSRCCRGDAMGYCLRMLGHSARSDIAKVRTGQLCWAGSWQEGFVALRLFLEMVLLEMVSAPMHASLGVIGPSLC